MGFLTTHVLDTAHGTPARGMALRLETGDGQVLGEFITNDDGRCDGPILPEGQFAVGRYRLIFKVGAYFRGQGVQLPDPAFLEDVALDFGIADPADHYHVPLLVSPYGYSTYRGS